MIVCYLRITSIRNEAHPGCESPLVVTHVGQHVYSVMQFEPSNWSGGGIMGV